MATKRLVEKYHFCENKVVCKCFESFICFQLSSCLHLLFSGAMINHSEAKQPVEERVHFPTVTEESGQETGGPKGCRDHQEMPLSGLLSLFSYTTQGTLPRGDIAPLSPYIDWALPQKTIHQENAPQACLQVNLMEAIPFPD